MTTYRFSKHFSLYLSVAQWCLGIASLVVLAMGLMEPNELFALKGFVLVLNGILFFSLSKLKKTRKVEESFSDSLMEDIKKESHSYQDASFEKSKFIMNMSHQLRSPLNGILGMSKLLDESELSNFQKEYVDCINDCSNHILSIVNDLLDLSRCETGEMELKEKEVNVLSLTNNIINSFKWKCDEKEISLNREITPGITELALVDEQRLRQIIVNILNDCIRNTKSGSIELKLSLLEESDLRQKIKVQVSDTRFYEMSEVQEENGSDKFLDSYGLGIKISKSLCKLFGSDLKCIKIERVGLQYHFEINLKNAQGDFSSESLHYTPAVKMDKNFAKQFPFKILLVEDDVINQKITTRMLDRLGYSCEVATSGEQAIELFAKDPYDIVLMDLSLPGLDGIETTNIILSDSKQRSSTTVIAMTARAYDEDRKKCFAAGMEHFISKPFSIEDVFNCLLKVSMEYMAKKTDVA